MRAIWHFFISSFLPRMDERIKSHVCSNEKWKESESLVPLLDIYARDNQKVVIIDSGREKERDWRTKGNVLRLKAKKHRLAFIRLLFPQYPGNCICMLCGWSRLHEVSPLAFWKPSKVWVAFRGLELMIGFASIAKQKQKFQCTSALFAVLQARKFCELQTLPADVAFNSYFIWIVSLPFIENADYFAWRLLNALFVTASRFIKYFDRLQRISIARYVRFVW